MIVPPPPSRPLPDPHEPAAAKRRRRVAVLLLSPVAGLLLLELSLRAVHDLGDGLKGWLYMPGACTRFDDVSTLPELLAAAGLEDPPGSPSGDWVLNSRALRTVEYADSPPAEGRRIVVLGDSHTWASGGMPFASLWHSRVAAALDGPGARRVELISLGVPAVGPAFEERMWEIEGARLAPDLVILALSVGNDLLEVDGELADQTALDRWARRSYAVRLLRNAGRLQDVETGSLVPALAEPWDVPAELRPGAPRPGAVPDYDRSAPRLSVEAHERLVLARLVNSDRLPGATARFGRALEHVAAILDFLDDDVRARGGRLVVLLIPDEYQLDEALFRRVVAEHGRDPAEFDVERPQRALREACAAEGIPCVDALPALRARAAHEPMFNLRESHLNDLGHAVLAELLTEAILGARWLE